MGCLTRPQMQAQAEAFAFGFVNATSTCPTALCTVDAEILTEAVNNVLAEAATSAITTGCASAPPLESCLPSQCTTDPLLCVAAVDCCWCTAAEHCRCQFNVELFGKLLL